MRILIVEDNHDIAGSIGDYMEFQGHVVDFASNGVMGLNLAIDHTFDAIVLDINMPRMNGFEVCRKLREEYQIETPVLMLTARDSLADKITGFELGAWDYLVKPFELKELLMRINALKHRLTPNQGRILSVGDLNLNLDSWQAAREGKPLNVHRASLKILEMLMRASPNAVSRQEIEFLLWGDKPQDSNSLRSHMYDLRRELDRPFDFKMLKTMRGFGFALYSKEDAEAYNHED